MVSLKKLIPLAFAGLAMGAIVLSPATGGIAFADVSGNTAEERLLSAKMNEVFPKESVYKGK